MKFCHNVSSWQDYFQVVVDEHDRSDESGNQKILDIIEIIQVYFWKYADFDIFLATNSIYTNHRSFMQVIEFDCFSGYNRKYLSEHCGP